MSPSNCKRTTCPESHGHGSARQREGESLDHSASRVQKKRGELEVKGQRSPPAHGNKKGWNPVNKGRHKRQGLGPQNVVQACECVDVARGQIIICLCGNYEGFLGLLNLWEVEGLMALRGFSLKYFSVALVGFLFTFLFTVSICALKHEWAQQNATEEKITFMKTKNVNRLKHLVWVA